MSPTPATDGRRTAAAARRRAREQQIIAATRALFDERGVRDAQIEDVARAVGINRAIIYRHFSGKEELFALTMVGYLDELDERLAPAARKRSSREQLRAVIETFVDFGLEYPAFVDCAQTLMRRPGPELLEEVSESAMFRLGRGIARCMEHIVAPLQKGTDAGEFKVKDPVLLANTLYATGLGGLQLARLGLLVRSAAPGIPEVAPLSPEQVKAYLVQAAVALATS
jgi:AcrR family transcriptional regulator